MRNSKYFNFLCLMTLAFAFSHFPRESAAQQNQGQIFLKGSSAFGLVAYSNLQLNDNVDGKCWTNGRSIKSKVHLLFAQNEITILDYEPAFYNERTVFSSVSAFGFRTNNGVCVVSAEFSVTTAAHTDFGGYDKKQKFGISHTSELFSQQSVFASSSNSNAQLTDFFEGAASNFLAQALSARRNQDVLHLKRVYPYEGPPISQQEWEDILAESQKSDEL